METGEGNTKKDIALQNKRGNACLTCGALAQMVVEVKAIRTQHDRSTGASRRVDVAEPAIVQIEVERKVRGDGRPSGHRPTSGGNPIAARGLPSGRSGPRDLGSWEGDCNARERKITTMESFFAGGIDRGWEGCGRD